eukprot:6552027-Alexandrium_andersonii.AAC.1
MVLIRECLAWKRHRRGECRAAEAASGAGSDGPLDAADPCAFPDPARASGLRRWRAGCAQRAGRRQLWR